jgi:uncharacterized protein (TIGR02466 family)
MSQHRQTVLTFPTPIHIVDFEEIDFCSRAAEFVKKIKNSRQGFGDKLCWTTPDDLHIRQEFEELKSLLCIEVEKVLDEVGLIRESFYISCMWANLAKAENRHALHLHANSYYSGVIYLEVPHHSGNIGFKDPRASSEMLSFDYTEESIFKNRTIEIEPKKGRLILFPSWLYHGTRSGNFDDAHDRISLSFNILPKCVVTDFSRKISL